MSGNNFHSGKGVAFQVSRKSKELIVEKLDNGCDGYSIRDQNGNRLDIPARPYLPQEYRHVKSMIRKLFGIVLALGIGVMIYLSNMPAAAQVP